MDVRVMQGIFLMLLFTASSCASGKTVDDVGDRDESPERRSKRGFFDEINRKLVADTSTDAIPALIKSLPTSMILMTTAALNSTEKMRVLGSLSGEEIMNLTNRMTQAERGRLLGYIPPEGVVSLASTLTRDQLGELLASLPTDSVIGLTQSLSPDQNLEIIQKLSPDRVLGLISGMTSDQAMSVLNSLPSDGILNLTKSFSPAELIQLIASLPPNGVDSLVSNLTNSPEGIATLLMNMSNTDILTLVGRLPPSTVAKLIPTLPQNLVQGLLPDIPADLISQLLVLLPQNVTSSLLSLLDNNTIVGIVQKLSASQTITLLSHLQQSDILQLLYQIPVDTLLNLLSNATGPEVSKLLQVVPKQVVSGILTSMSVPKIVNLAQTFPPENLAYLLLSLNSTQISDLLNTVPQPVTFGLISTLPPKLLANFTAAIPLDQLTKLLMSLTQNQTTSLLQQFPPEALSVLVANLLHSKEVLLNLTMSLSEDALVAILTKLPGSQISNLIKSLPSDSIDQLVQRVPVQLVFNLTRVLESSFLLNLKLTTVIGVLMKNPDNLVKLINDIFPGGIFGILNSGLIPKGVLEGLLGSVTPQQLEGLLALFPEDKLQPLISALVPDLLKQMTKGNASLDLSTILTPDVIKTVVGGVPLSDLLGIVGQLLPQLPLMLAQSVHSLADSPLVQSRTTGLDQCLTDIQLFLTDLSNATKWAVDMFDAYGKPGRGIQKGNTHMHGNYEQCLEVSHAILNGSSVLREIKGSYCGVELTLPPGVLPPVPAKGILPDIVVEIYACLPNSCFDHDLQLLFSSLNLPLNLTIPRVSCQQDEDITGDTRAIAAICVLACIGLLMVVGTAFDIFHTKDDDPKGFNIPEEHINGGFKLQEQNTVEENGEMITSFSSTPTSNGGTGFIPTSDDAADSDDEEENVSTVSRILLAFSLPRNTDRLLNVVNTPDNITCLHGIRVLSVGWLIVGYTIYIMALFFENALGAAEALEGIVGQVVIHSTLAVDTFLVVSGCLTAFLFVRESVAEEGVKAKNVCFYFVHRFIRLTPAYAITIMALTCLLPYMSDGPNWTRETRDYYSSCKTYWWTNLLYINNFYKSLSDQCMPWSWYLSVDMQFHWLVAPIIIIPLAFGAISGKKWIKAIAGLLIGCLVLMQIVLTIYLEENINGDFLRNREDFHWIIYEKPYTRIAPYALGLGFGYALAQIKGHAISKAGAAVAWLFSIAVIFATTWLKYNENHVMLDDPFHWSHGARAAHEAVYRPAFSFAVCIVIFLCGTGNGGFINSILSWRGFLPFSRLTYGMFLLHPAVIQADQWQARIPVYFTLSYMGQRAAGYFVITAIFAYVLSVTVETPITALEKIIFKRKRTTQSTSM